MARLPLLRLFSLAIRQLMRDARAGELRVLFLIRATPAISNLAIFWLHHAPTPVGLRYL